MNLSPVISTDIDFYQLHDIPNFRQVTYNNIEKTKVHACKGLKIDTSYDISPDEFLTLKLLNGDAKDDVPNFQNPDDIWSKGTEKYKRLGGKTAISILEQDNKAIKKYGTLEYISETPGYKRNNKVLNLRNIPQDISKGILDVYLNYEHTGSLKKIQTYLDA